MQVLRHFAACRQRFGTTHEQAQNRVVLVVAVSHEHNLEAALVHAVELGANRRLFRGVCHKHDAHITWKLECASHEDSVDVLRDFLCTHSEELIEFDQCKRRRRGRLRRHAQGCALLFATRP